MNWKKTGHWRGAWGHQPPQAKDAHEKPQAEEPRRNDAEILAQHEFPTRQGLGQKRVDGPPLELARKLARPQNDHRQGRGQAHRLERDLVIELVQVLQVKKAQRGSGQQQRHRQGDDDVNLPPPQGLDIDRASHKPDAPDHAAAACLPPRTRLMKYSSRFIGRHCSSFASPHASRTMS